MSKGFTLVEILIVIAIIAILAAVVIVMLNPLELMARGRDATRLSDFENLQKAINLALENSQNTTAEVLCHNLTPPCIGNSDDGGEDIRNIDGSGWLKVSFYGSQTASFRTLPTDPLNNEVYHYEYYSDGNVYELNTALESQREQSKMQSDGGDNNNLYESGLSLTLLH